MAWATRVHICIHTFVFGRQPSGVSYPYRCRLEEQSYDQRLRQFVISQLPKKRYIVLDGINPCARQADTAHMCRLQWVHLVFFKITCRAAANLPRLFSLWELIPV